MIKKINIFSVEYTIEYCDKPSDVDINKRTSMWGQIDYWSRTIRIYKGIQKTDIMVTIIHEVIHGIMDHLNLDTYITEDNEGFVDTLATGLVDTLMRNNLISEKAFTTQK